MATEDQTTENGALLETFALFHETAVRDASSDGEQPYLIVPQGKRIESLKPILDQYRALPERRKGTAQLRDVESFIALVDRFKGDASIIYANPDRTQPSVTAVFDYSPRGGDATQADWHRHRATYAPQLSDEWKAWSARNGQQMQQAEFAAFIEDRVTDLVVPNLDDPRLKTFAGLVDGVWASPADMVRLSRGLQINVESVVKNAQVLNSGELSIVYEEVHRDGAGEPLKVPTLFRIAIPVFYAGELYGITARLRYRQNAGKITWWYQLVRPDLAFDHAFNGKQDSPDEKPSIVERIRQETQLPVLLGAPEKE